VQRAEVGQLGGRQLRQVASVGLEVGHRDVERPVTVTGAPSQGWRSQAASESDWNSPEPSW
jgi:hypothetical protein